MAKPYRTSAIFVAALMLLLSACSKKEADQPVRPSADVELLEQVRPSPFEGVEKDQRAALEVKQLGGALIARNKKGNVRLTVEGRGNIIEALGERPGPRLELAFDAVGREGEERARQLRMGAASKDGNIVRRPAGTDEEYFINRSRGIEHRLILGNRPTGDKGRVLVDVSVGGGFEAFSTLPTSAVFEHPSGTKFDYDGLKVFDAKGRVLPAMMWPVETASGRDLRIAFNDRDAVYPVTVDPVLSGSFDRLFPALSAATSCPFAPADFLCGFGYSVDVHGDWMVVGHPGLGAGGLVEVYQYDGVGAWVLRRRVAAPMGAGAYGNSVSIWTRADGVVVIAVGDPEGSGEGRVEVLQIAETALAEYPPVTAFDRQILDDDAAGELPGGTLTVGAQFGWSVATNGDRIVVGAPSQDNGWVYIFDWVSSTTFDYFGESSTIPSIDGQNVALGYSVAISDRFVVAGSPKTVDQYKQYTITIGGTTAGDYSVTINGTDTVTVTTTGTETIDQLRDSLINQIQIQAGTAAIVDATVGGPGTIRLTGDALGNDYTATVGGTGDPMTIGVTTPIRSGSRAIILDMDNGFAMSFQQVLDPDVNFGWSVDTAGDRIVIGAPDAGPGNEGAVYSYTIDRAMNPATYAFDTTTNGTGVGDRLGFAVATSGTVDMASAIGTTTGGADNSGTVYDITNSTTDQVPYGNGRYQHGATPGPGVYFGQSFAIDPTSTVGSPKWVAGAPGLTFDRRLDGGGPDQPNGAVVSGTVSPGVSPGLDLVTVQQYSETDLSFGADIDISGDLAVVYSQAPSTYPPRGDGMLYLYERDPVTSSYTLVEAIEPPQSVDYGAGPAIVTRFAGDVATNGQLIAATVETASERALIFYSWDSVNDTLALETLATSTGTDAWALRDSGGTISFTLGDVALDFEGNHLVAGFPSYTQVTYFNTSAIGSISGLNDVHLDSPVGGDDYGADVDLNVAEGLVAVGAPLDAGGRVYLLQYGGTLTNIQEIPDMAPYDTATLGIAPGHNFGASVGFDDGWLAVGSPGSSSFEGSVYFFGQAGGTITSSQRVRNTEQAISAASPSSMGVDVDLLDGVAVSNDEAAGAVISFVNDGTTWSINDVSFPAGLYDDGISYPGPLALVDEAGVEPDFAAAGSPDTVFQHNTGPGSRTGSVVLHPVRTPVAADLCDGIDNDGDTIVDEDATCSGNGPTWCVNGACLTPCTTQVDCAGGETCVVDPAVSPTEGSCKVDETCGAGERLRNGQCVEECDPTGPNTCTAPNVCADDPMSGDPTVGLCVDSVDVCNSDGFLCPPDSAGDPQTCKEGECVQDCTTDAECTDVANSYCDAFNATTNPDGTDTCISPEPIACDTKWCPVGSFCEDGACQISCTTSAPCGTDVCATDSAGSNGRCVPDPDPCVGVACPYTNGGDPQTCYNGVCHPECVDDTDCAPPTICIDLGFCVLPDPCDSMVCPVGDVCFEGSCFEACTTNCPSPGDICTDNLDSTARCTDSSCTDVLCPVGEFCMNGVCGDPCNVDSDCGDTYLCEGACAIVPPDSDCAQGGVGRCLPGDCQNVNCPFGEVCVDGVCGDTCTPGSCPAGEVCYNGGCTADPCSPNPCGAGETCYGGSCYTSCTPATVTADCAPGQVCTDNRCTESACSGIDCPFGQVCYDGSCYSTCVDDGDCTPPNLCFNNVCAADPCDGVTCPVGEVCYGGSCAPPCGSTTPCLGDGDCSITGETCQNKDPVSGYGFCVGCSGEECWALGCADDADCGTGRYCFKNGTSLSGACLPTGCDPTAGCTTGTLSCRNDACEGVQCPVGQVCYDGSCYDPCVNDGDCTPPNRCFDQVCTDDLCRGTNCPVGQVCFGGECYDPCADDDDCDDPRLCFEGRCAEDACKTKDGAGEIICPVGEVCVQGGCFEDCTVNTDCSDFIGLGSFTEVANSVGIAVPGDKEGGVSFVDMTGNGCLDLLVNTRAGSVRSRYFQSDCNLPSPAYNDVSSVWANHFLDRMGRRSLVTGDLNNDGHNDVIRVREGGEVHLYLNEGLPNYELGLGFPDSPNQTWYRNPEGAGILDYDGDKNLDFIIQEGDDVDLYINNGSGSFTRDGNGVVGQDEDGDYCAVVDWDVDGDVDVHCRFDKTNNEGRDMFRNDGGTFTAIEVVEEDADDDNKAGNVFCDYDNDGDFDLFWAGDGTNQFWEQPDNGDWMETGKPRPESGLDLNQGKREVEGADCGDVDNDGDMDLFVARGDNQEDQLFINQLMETGTATFVADNRGIQKLSETNRDSEQGVFVDYDNDGDLDIYVHNDQRNFLWKNPLTGSDYIMVRPRVDLGGGIFRNGTGATITIYDADDQMLGVREVNGGSGRGITRQIPVHVGLKNGDNVPYKFVVQFPHGPVVERCVIPNTLNGYRVYNVNDTMSDDTTACDNAGVWQNDIVVPASGEYCFEDHCAANACDGIQCSTGFICVGGSCVESCTNDTDCPNFPMDICYQNRCADATNPACDKVKCPSDQECYAGECFRNCTSASDCPGNEFCYQGRCAEPTCTKIGGNCLSNEVCHQGTCFLDCSGDPSVCPAGTACYDGQRCAANACEAMMVNYQTNHIFTQTGRKLTADQYSRPYFWPRPILGPGGTPLATYANFSAGTSNVGGVHKAGAARVAVYLDRTLSDGDNPEGRYVVWLTHGQTTTAQVEARANYQVTLNRNGTSASLAPVFVDDANEAVKHLTDGDRELLIAQITSEAGTTGGVAFGPLPARLEDWTISIDASFSGGINSWEFYNPETGTATDLKMGEQLVLRGLGMSPDVVLSPESGFACDMPPEALLNGNCDNGTLSCTNQNLGYTRCDQTVFNANFEICDGEDNNCDGNIDETIAVRVPYVQFNQQEGWKYWVPADSTNDFFTDLDFVPTATDDRVGSTNYIMLESTPLQAEQKSAAFQHRNVASGELMVGFLHGARDSGGGDRNIEMSLRYPGSGVANTESYRDASILYFDDGTNDQIPDNLDAGNWELDLRWQLDENGGLRESDGIGIRPHYRQYATGQLSYFTLEFDGNDDDNDDWTDDGLQWLMYQPKLLPPYTENELFKSRDLNMRVSSVSLSGSFCPADMPFTGVDPITLMTETCELGRYTCSGGVLDCGPAVLPACDECIDADGDGYPRQDPALCPSGTDCNDDVFEINPGALEQCNGLDDDCDGTIDRTFDPLVCPNGAAECGPSDCEYRNVCVCPDGPEDPLNPPSEPCFCGDGLDASSDPAEPAPADDAALFEDRGAACSAAAGSPLDGDLPLLVVFGAFGLIVTRRRRR